MSFILKLRLIQQITFLSILGDCTQLSYQATLTVCGDCLSVLQHYNAALLRWQFTASQSLRSGLLCTYCLDPSGSLLYPYFYPVNPKI